MHFKAKIAILLQGNSYNKHIGLVFLFTFTAYMKPVFRIFLFLYFFLSGGLYPLNQQLSAHRIGYFTLTQGETGAASTHGLHYQALSAKKISPHNVKHRHGKRYLTVEDEEDIIEEKKLADTGNYLAALFSTRVLQPLSPNEVETGILSHCSNNISPLSVCRYLANRTLRI